MIIDLQTVISIYDDNDEKIILPNIDVKLRIDVVFVGPNEPVFDVDQIRVKAIGEGQRVTYEQPPQWLEVKLADEIEDLLECPYTDLFDQAMEATR